MDISEEKISHLIDTIINAGFIVKANDVRLRNAQQLDLSLESFVVFSQSNQMLQRIIRRTFIHYDYGSECIFVEKRQKRGVYSFILDKRLLKRSTGKLIQLFEIIKREWV